MEELQAAQSELNELSAVGRALSVRQVVVDAANTVVGKNVALCAEYTRRVELASAQLTEQEGTGLVGESVLLIIIIRIIILVTLFQRLPNRKHLI